MVYIIVFLAFILTWFFIEITLFLANKNFIWYLRILAISLFFVTTVYMYFFENDKLLQAIEYCLGIVN